VTTSLDAASQDRFLNRELSWLDFNARVLALAEDDSTPVLERAKFLAIFSSNLDEFYMVRVAGLKRQVAAGLSALSPDGRSPRDQLLEISERAQELAVRQTEIFLEDVSPQLGTDGIEITRWDQLEDEQRKELDEFFTERIFPVVTPLAVDPGHPFPYISHLSLNLAVQVRDPENGVHFARVKVPPVIARFIALSNEETFVPLEDVIAANLDQLFPGMEIVEHHFFRVTRNADLEVDDEGAEDLLQALEDELRKRRFSPAVRLETEGELPAHIRELLLRELQITEADVHVLDGPLGLSGLWDLYELDRPELKDDPFQPATHPALTKSELVANELVKTEEPPATIFDALRDRGDILVHHPYYSFRTSVQRFIEQAAADPDVLAIKQTLYRTSGESPIVDALIDAAEAGKQVVVLVEIQARFDERANIQWARTLEQAGCHVVYGVVGLKTHCKLCLVVRREGSAIRRYAHVGTGNYNPKTARLYEDIGLLTADQQLAADVGHLFNYLTGYSRSARFNELIVAPNDMRSAIIEMIERESNQAREGQPARIVMKLNALVDEGVIDALYSASRAGVEIDLIVRSICTLRPGIPDLSETIKVRSILGRFLEHSRILYFHNGGAEDMYIGSADMMHRNLDRRVEALARITSRKPKEQLKSIIDLSLADNYSAWTLDPDGTWERSRPGNGEAIVHLQKELMDRARSNA
jgi:polyphosphate kinase